jgi:hypothetical protein
MRKAFALLGTLCVAAVLAGCGSGSDGPKQPAAGAFAAGTCRVAAPDVLALGRGASKLGKGPEIPSAMETSMAAAQRRLQSVTDGAEPAYQPALRKLVVAVGLVRLRAHTGTYVTSLGKDVTSAYDGVLAVCTKPSAQ